MTINAHDGTYTPVQASEPVMTPDLLGREATLTDLSERVARIEAVLWPPDSDPGEGVTVPEWDAYGGVWPAGTLLLDGGTVYRNVTTVPLTTPPSGFPGDPDQWGHLFVRVGEPDPAPDAAPWDPDTEYDVGNLVEYEGTVYECLIAHGPERQGTWKPGTAPTVWQAL